MLVEEENTYLKVVVYLEVAFLVVVAEEEEELEEVA